jgi:hypothetical protein
MPNSDIQPSPTDVASWDYRDNAAPDATGNRWGLFHVEDYADLKKSESNWDKYFPYQLLILDDKGDGSYPLVKGDNGPLQFTLPIPPEAMTITTPFAINGAVTLDGYVEQHGGAPLKMIGLSGTTGLLPSRASTEPTGMAPAVGLGQAIFAGSLQAAQALGSTLASLRGVAPQRVNVYTQDEFSDSDPSKILAKTTGYYQFRLLQRFLEGYAAIKKTRAGRTYRLAFAVWKDQAVYLCTPLMFGLKRSVESPLEYKYDLQLKAFGRISAQKTFPIDLLPTSTRDVNGLAKILNKVRTVRATLQAGTALLRAVGADIENVVLSAVREVSFGLKDAIGIAQTAIDLPHSIVRDIRTYTVAQWNDVKAAAKNLANSGSASDRFLDDLGILDDAAEVHKVTPINQTAHEVHEIFENPDEHPEILDAIDPRGVVLPDAVTSKIDAERDRVRAFGRLDYEQRRDSFLNAAAAYANAVGAGSDTYNQTYSVRSSQVARRTPTDSDFEILYALNEAAIQLAKLAARAATSGPQITPIEYIAGLAAQSEIRVNVPRSKLAVPFLYGHTLEEMAQIYLGDPDRWFEIAALNGLREPYVDEDGFTLPLLVNARGNTVFVSDASNLYQGQVVWVEGDAMPRDKRHVVSTTKIATSLYSVVLDGDTTLDQFTLQANARLHAFLPHTVNSQMLVYIPSDSAPTEDPRTKEVPGVDDFDHLLAVGGIDLLLTPKNDIVITPDGDGRWAYGLTNIVQQARIYLNTPLGANKRHPKIGFAVQPGTTSARVTAQDVLRAANDTFLQDSTYTGVQSASIVRNGGHIQAVLALSIRGTSQSVPITVDVARQ